MESIRIPAKHALSFEISEGETFDVIDAEGQQVADLVAFYSGDTDERFSAQYTYKRTGKVRISTGDSLFTTAGKPLLAITADECGTHDLLYGPCNDWILDDYGQRSDTHGCRENLVDVLSPEGIPPIHVHSTFNVFMKATVAEQTYIDIREPVSQPGDSISFEAVRDSIVGVSACAGESTVNAGRATPIDVRIPGDSLLRTNFDR